MSPANPVTTAPAATIQSANAPAPAVPTAAPSSLYVGELHLDVTESMLFELFSQVGTVASIRVCRDAVTRRSLGYAYVNYHGHQDAEKALDAFNYTVIKGRPCRIMWSQRDPSVRRSGNGNIFIKNLDKLIDTKALHDTFSAFGNILSCKVVSDENGSKGFGFVHFETQDSAEQAISKVNGMLLNDKKVFVGIHIPRRERQSKAEEMRAMFTNVYIKNLDESVSDEEFYEMFSRFGSITSAAVSRDEAGKSKGFGFVNFESHEAAEMAVAAMNDTEYKGKMLYVGRAQKKSERDSELKKSYEQAKLERINKYQGTNLYVKNLDETVDDEKIKQEFSVYGNITSAKIMRDEKGASKGFGFVCFATPDEAAKAVTEMNGRMIANKPIYVALAQRREIRRQQLEAQYAQRAQMRMQQIPAYPGAPMFYPPNAPNAPRPMMFNTPQMMARPRWAGPPGARPPFPQGNAMNQARPPRSQNPRPTAKMPPNAAPVQAAQKRQFKYTSNVRNARPENPSTVGLTLATLANATPEVQKRMLGDRLFPLVQAHEAEYAGKITGMLLEMDNSELLHLLESPEALAMKVNEAVVVLKAHLASQS